jgi:hypothetical protein
VNTRGRWLLRVGVLVVAAVSPLVIGGAGRAEAQCLAFFGSRNDGTCLDQKPGTAQSQGGAIQGPPPAAAPAAGAQPVTGGVPPVAIGPGQNGGTGISTGPLFPGQTINQPLTPGG